MVGVGKDLGFVPTPAIGRDVSLTRPGCQNFCRLLVHYLTSSVVSNFLLICNVNQFSFSLKSLPLVLSNARDMKKKSLSLL